MIPHCPHEVSRPVPATALLVDIRNFTPNLNAAREDDQGVNLFCHFLSAFYALCLRAALLALPAPLRSQPPLYMSSTGDGVLIIFTHATHVRNGFLTAILLHLALLEECGVYNSNRGEMTCPRTSFGIGVESGQVSRVRAQSPGDPGYPLVDTYIGPCINVAARAEAVSKLLHRANTIVSHEINSLLCKELFGTDYDELIERALHPSINDIERLALHDRMNDMNRGLCLSFIHQHHLKGVDEPVALFRLANSSVEMGNPRFEALLGRLTEDPDHLSDVRLFLSSLARNDSTLPPGA